MIKLRDDIQPSQNSLTQLAEFQATIDALSTFELRSAKAKDMFPKKNTKANPVFKDIKIRLTEMCNSTRRCVYCEDSLGDEVEHIYPKDLYPDKCFNWDNYVYACGPCNGPKNNKFAVFKNDDGEFTEVNPPKGTPASAPPMGEPALINPRIEDPLKFAILDLAGTFKFYALPNISDTDKKKMEYSYNDVLRLNHEEREPLRQARENAYLNYKSRLGYYSSEKTRGAAQNELNKLIENLKKENHPTVWKEIQRYHTMGYLNRIDPAFDSLLVQSPEALAW